MSYNPNTVESFQAFLVRKLTNSGQTMNHETATKIVENYTREQFEAGWRARGKAVTEELIEKREFTSLVWVDASETPPAQPVLKNNSSGHDDVLQANLALHLEKRCGGKEGGCKICEHEIKVEPAEEGKS